MQRGAGENPDLGLLDLPASPAMASAVPPWPLDTCREQEPAGTHPCPQHSPCLGEVMAERNPAAEREAREAAQEQASPEPRQQHGTSSCPRGSSSTGGVLAVHSPGWLLDCPGMPSPAAPVAEQQDVAWTETLLSWCWQQTVVRT